MKASPDASEASSLAAILRHGALVIVLETNLVEGSPLLLRTLAAPHHVVVQHV
jgi:hypothetical protein